MEHVYLGLFAKIFKWVFEKILQPIIEFIASILSKILTWVFNNVMKPMLLSIVWPTVKAIASLLMDVFSTFLFDLVSMLYKCIEYVLKFFEIFSGVADVEYDGQKMPFINVLFVSPVIQRGVLAVTAIGFVLLLVFSTVAVIHSLGDAGGELKRPVSKVLQSTFKGFVRMMAIPITCLFLVSMSGVVLRGIYNGVKQVSDQGQSVTTEEYTGSSTTIPRVIFCLTTLDAAKDSTYNISTPKDQRKANIGLNDDLRAQYYFEDYSNKSGGKSKDFTDRSVVEKQFEYKDIDYSLAIPLCLAMLFLLIVCVIKFIERIFNILILFVISPIFASTMPMDDGKRYDNWKEAFVGQLFMGFGSVIAMQIYLMLIPYLMDSRLTFGDGTPEANALIKVILLFGGAYSVYSAGTLITGILSGSAASAERSAQAHGALVAKSAGSTALGVARFAGRAGLAAGAYVGGKLKPEPYKSKKELRTEKEKEQEKTGKLKGGGYANKTKRDELKQNRYLGGIFTKTFDKDGKGHLGINLGKNFRIGMRKDGTWKMNVFGFTKKYDKNGKLTSKSNPFVKHKLGDDGKMHVSKVSVPGMKFRAKEDHYKDKDGNEQVKIGGMYMSDFSPLGMQRSYDQNTGEVNTDSVSMFGKSIYEREPKDDQDQ